MQLIYINVKSQVYIKKKKLRRFRIGKSLLSRIVDLLYLTVRTAVQTACAELFHGLCTLSHFWGMSVIEFQPRKCWCHCHLSCQILYLVLLSLGWREQTEVCADQDSPGARGGGRLMSEN